MAATGGAVPIAYYILFCVDTIRGISPNPAFGIQFGAGGGREIAYLHDRDVSVLCVPVASKSCHVSTSQSSRFFFHGTRVLLSTLGFYLSSALASFDCCFLSFFSTETKTHLDRPPSLAYKPLQKSTITLPTHTEHTLTCARC